MDQVLQLNEFFVEGGDQNTSHVLLHITEPSTPEEKEKGYFFAVCEINHTDTEGIALFQKIISEVENQYYEVSGTPEQSALEIILERVNQENFSLQKKEPIYNATIGVIRETEIIFAFAGKPQALLFYRDKESHYRKMDLTQENQSNENPDNENQTLFPQVIQGKIGPNDYLFVATPHVIDYFSHDRLQKIITTRPARQSAEHLGRVLRELQNNLSFGGLIIHLGKKEEPVTIVKKTRPASGSSANSLSTFFSTEKNTASTLSASLWPMLNNKLKAVSEKMNGTPTAETRTNAYPPPRENSYQPAEINGTHVRQHQPTPLKPTPPGVSYYLLSIGKILIQGFLYLGRALIWIAVTLYSICTQLLRSIAMLFFIATNYQGRRRTIMENWSRERRSHRENFRSLSIVTKLMLGAAVLLIIIFIGSIFFVRYQQNKKLALKTYQDNVELVKNKINAAENALIYKDETGAENAVAEARTTLATLPCKSAEENSTCQTLTSNLETIVNKLNKITTASTQKLAEWNTSTTPLTGLVRIKNKFIAYSDKSTSLFSYDLLTKQPNVVATNFSATGFTGAAVPKENTFIALITDQKDLLEVNPEDLSIKKIELTLPNDTTQLDSVVIYNGRLYALDKNAKQIYRYDPIKGGFAIGRPWLKDVSNIVEGATDITIDGDIFAFKKEGSIIKLTAGNVAPFQIQTLSPALSEKTRLWTYTDITYLYALDPTNKRLVIFDKTGTLHSQVSLADLTEPTDLFVDEANKIGYIINQNSLFAVTLPI